MYRDYQSRLLTVHDNIKQKLLDNHISHTGHPTDVLRIRCTRNREGDIVTRTVSGAEIIQVVFPPLKKVPVRTLSDENGMWAISPLACTEKEANQFYKVVCPHNQSLSEDDLLFKVFVDKDVKRPFVFGLRVVEHVADIGQNSLLQHEFNCVPYEEALPQEMLQMIADIAIRRMNVKF